ncbi:MAG: GAF domain-containing protein [Nitrospirota bacterium]
MKMDTSKRRESEEDITEQKQTEEKILKKTMELSAINEIINSILKDEEPEKIEEQILNVVLNLTKSKYGFYGLLNDRGNFDTKIITHLGAEQCKLQKEKAWSILIDMSITGIWGWVLKNAQPLLTNDPSSHPESIGVPEWHPPINSFLGVPLISKEKAIGMIGVANKSEGYSKEDIETLTSIANGITIALERQKTDRLLKESEERFRNLFNNVREGIFISTREGRLLVVNKAMVEMLGYNSEDEMYQLDLAGNVYFKPEDREHLIDEYRKKGYVKDFEVPLKRKDGEIIYVSINATAVKDLEGRTIQFEGLLIDVTKRKKAEEELRKHLDEVEKLNKFMIGRELRMTELKKKIKELEKQLEKQQKSSG